jgi:hypothetical protein
VEHFRVNAMCRVIKLITRYWKQQAYSMSMWYHPSSVFQHHGQGVPKRKFIQEYFQGKHDQTLTGTKHSLNTAVNGEHCGSNIDTNVSLVTDNKLHIIPFWGQSRHKHSFWMWKHWEKSTTKKTYYSKTLFYKCILWYFMSLLSCPCLKQTFTTLNVLSLLKKE